MHIGLSIQPGKMNLRLGHFQPGGLFLGTFESACLPKFLLEYRSVCNHPNKILHLHVFFFITSVIFQAQVELPPSHVPSFLIS